MSIKIHHGPPGSYKTSGAVADDFVAAVLAGRHVITNVRGLNDPEKIVSVLESQGKIVPASFKLTWLDSTEREKMEMLQRFWHWAPDGCFFLIDEVQEVWPRAMRDAQLKKLDYPEGQDQANFDGRFLTIALAFEKHRHKNWDFVVTSPNISKVHPVVRSCSESAYKHKNLATLGRFFKGRYVEGYHSADTNGKPSDFYSILRKRIPAYVFDLYQSTATGQHSDTIAGQSLFKDPKILGLLVFLVLVIIAAISMGTPKIVDKTLHNTHTETVPASGAVDSKKAGSAPGASPGLRPAVVGSGAVPALPPRLRFLTASQKILITGTYSVGSRKHFFLRVFLNGGQYFELSDSQAAGLGLSVSQLTPCYFILSAGGVTSYAFCEEEEPPPDRPDASPANSTQVASSQPEGAAPPPRGQPEKPTRGGAALIVLLICVGLRGGGRGATGGF